jgi:protein-tyrosine phosphatase
MTVRTSLTDPIRVHFLPPEYLPVPGKLGVTIAPGKQAPSYFGSPWQRDLELDLQRLVEVYQTDCLVSLLEEHEFQRFHIASLRERARELGMEVLHLPIPDGSPPPDMATFQTITTRIITHLKAGQTVVIHCRGGLGRAGTVAAAVLIRLGESADAAMRQVRQVRPGAIETTSQEAFLHTLACQNQDQNQV